MSNNIEIQRNNVTLAEFLGYVKRQCEKKGLMCDIDRDEFEKPTYISNNRYYIKDNVQYSTCDGYRSESEAENNCLSQAEIYCNLPCSTQTYFLNYDGSCFNEICEFTFDSEKNGHGYYYQAIRNI